MKSLYDFIVKPLDERYNNTKKIKDKNLILNVNIENHLSVSKDAIVISTPKAYKTKIKVGDKVKVHHNVFRRFYDAKGQERNSRSFFKDDLFFCDPLQIYMYNNKCHLNYCFVAPVANNNKYKTSKESLQLGILKYGNKALEAIKIKPGDLVTFTPDSEFEFLINDQKLYCMKSNNIAIVYEDKRNEKEYNPSWANSGARVNKSSARTYSGHGGGCICGSFEECRCN